MLVLPLLLLLHVASVGGWRHGAAVLGSRKAGRANVPPAVRRAGAGYCRRELSCERLRRRIQLDVGGDCMGWDRAKLEKRPSPTLSG